MPGARTLVLPALAATPAALQPRLAGALVTGAGLLLMLERIEVSLLDLLITWPHRDYFSFTGWPCGVAR